MFFTSDTLARDARARDLTKRRFCQEWLGGHVQAGAQHLVLRFAGDHDRLLDAFAKLRPREG